MMVLEEEGYIHRPHTSSGAVPGERAYRYYVESILETKDLPPQEQILIQHLFHQVETHLEEWTKLAAALLAKMAHNAALVTVPKSPRSRFKHIELIGIQELVALLVLVLKEARVKQQLLAFGAAVSQEEMSTATNHLNDVYDAQTSVQISRMKLDLSPLEKEITRNVVYLMQGEDEKDYEEIYLHGLRHMLGQPEFVGEARWRRLLEIMEERSLLKALLPDMGETEGVKVLIGDENRDEMIRDCSLVVSRYGIPGQISGVLGVLGPMRMRYDYTIATVRYMSTLMSGLVAERYGRQRN